MLPFDLVGDLASLEALDCSLPVIESSRLEEGSDL
jgi:hypothetical protein